MDRTLLALIVFFAALVFGVGVIANAYGGYVCNNYERTTGHETKWVFLDTCYVKSGNSWARYDEYVARAVTNEK